jgi:uncharacterized protein YkwD
MVKMCALISGRGILWAASLACALGAVGCTTVDYADGPSQQNPLDSEESLLIVKLNELRAAAGAGAVKACASLNVAVSLHSDDMRDNGYLDDNAPSGSTPFERACAAGYKPACDKPVGITAGMAELVAKGHAEADPTLGQWSADAPTRALLEDKTFVVVGIGRALSTEVGAWTVDLATVEHESCAP